MDPWAGTCPTVQRTAAEDFAAEQAALFGNRNPPRLWRNTSFLFSDETFWNVELILDQTAWDRMRDDPAAEQYEVGGFRVTGPSGELGTWTGVGIRFKGYVGSLRICLIPDFGIECNKLSYKIKFDYTNPAQRFFGLKRLQFHASLGDPSMMRERLAYSLFRESGIPTVRQTYSTLKRVATAGGAGNHLGIHIMTEVLDGRFTQANFKGNGDGNLYKEAWPVLNGASAARTSAYFEERLRTNSGDDANGGSGPNVQHLVNFNDAVNAATDDFTLAQVIKQYTAAQDWAKYLAIDRAIEHWDGPTNFRYESDGRSWTHNFFLFEDDDATLNTREFRMVPWDLDGTFNPPSGGTTGARPPYDAPVCSPSSPGSSSQAANSPPGCIRCSDFASTGGLSRSMPPSCFKINRAFFARGLRHIYMDKARELMEGPLQKCRILSKLDRWKAQLDAPMAADLAAGVYPGQPGQQSANFDQNFESMKTRAVPTVVGLFRESVACGEGGSRYTPAMWGSMYAKPVGEMLDIGAALAFIQMSGWNGGGPRAFPVALVIVLSALAVVLLVVLFVLRKKVQAVCMTACADPTPAQVSTEITSSTYKGGVVQVKVEKPAEAVGGQTLLVNSPAGGVLLAAVPLEPCTAFAVTVPQDTPVSRSVNVIVPATGKLGVTLETSPSSAARFKLVVPGGAVGMAGVKQGESIVSINGVPVSLGADAYERGTSMLGEAKAAGKTIELQVTSWVPVVSLLTD